jgi:hypothetical protein
MHLGTLTFELSSLYHRTIVVSFWLTTTYISIHSVYQAGTLLAVASGIFPPERCPDQFGSVVDAYTIRRVWGCVPSFFAFVSVLTEMHASTVALGTNSYGMYIFASNDVLMFEQSV